MISMVKKIFNVRFINAYEAIVVVVVFGFLLVLLIPSRASALEGGTPYFTDRLSYASGFGNAVIRCGIPEDVWNAAAIGDKSPFINFIQDSIRGSAGGWNYSHGHCTDSGFTTYDAHNNQIGADYIVKAMIGNGFGTTTMGSFSQPDIDTWYRRITNNSVSIMVNSGSFDYNTLIYSPDDLDNANVFRYYEPASDNGELIFYNTNNINERYFIIKRECGNPLGQLDGLPDKDYSLSPTISLDPSDSMETGSSVKMTSEVRNAGTTSSDDNTSWWISKTVDGSARSDVARGAKSFPTGDQVFDIRSDTDDDPVGSRVCYTLHVQPRASSDNGEATSTACITIGKKPKVQITGGDLWTRKGTNTSISNLSQVTYGSWVEYGIMAGKTVLNTSSGAALVGGSSSITNACSYSNLTFNNSSGDYKSSCSDDSSLGNYSNISSSLPDISADFSGGSTLSAGTVTPGSGSLSSGGVYNVIDNLILNSGTLSSGQSIILKVSGTVTIAGDQKYTDSTYTSIDQIPQLVIIANNIIINDDVTNVDAWLIAKNSSGTGWIKTCSDFDKNNWTISNCNQELVVNGPVVTDKLYLYRTANADLNTPDSPAEKFNFRADAYLWAYNYASKNNRIQTVYTKEVPPRF